MGFDALAFETSIQYNNTWVVPVVRYGAGILNWTAQELRTMDTKTRKLMNALTTYVKRFSEIFKLKEFFVNIGFS